MQVQWVKSTHRRGDGQLPGVLLAWLQAAAGAFLYACQLRRRLRKLQPDIVHSNGMKMHLLSALAKGDTPLVWHLHDYLSARPAMKPLLRRLSHRCQSLIANSESVAADARQVLPQRLQVHVVYNAVDPDVFTPEGLSLDLDELAGLPPAAPGTVRAGLVATFAFWKGHEVFLRAAAACQSTHPIRFLRSRWPALRHQRQPVQPGAIDEHRRRTRPR